MEATQEQKTYAEIVQKAWDDEDFKKELIANPINVIESFTGEKINLPKGKTLFVKDQTNDSHIYLNIPRKPNLDDVELNEEHLEMVAGGVSVKDAIMEVLELINIMNTPKLFR